MDFVHSFQYKLKMSVCVCVRAYLCERECVRAYLCVYVCVRVRVFSSNVILARNVKSVCVCKRACVCECVRVRVCAYVCDVLKYSRVQTHTYTHKQKHTHARMHTRTRKYTLFLFFTERSACAY